MVEGVSLGIRESTLVSVQQSCDVTVCDADVVYKNTERHVSVYLCNHGSLNRERDTASPRGHYGERLQRDSCLKHTI